MTESTRGNPYSVLADSSDDDNAPNLKGNCLMPGCPGYPNNRDCPVGKGGKAYPASSVRRVSSTTVAGGGFLSGTLVDGLEERPVPSVAKKIGSKADGNGALPSKMAYNERPPALSARKRNVTRPIKNFIRWPSRKNGRYSGVVGKGRLANIKARAKSAASKGNEMPTALEDYSVAKSSPKDSSCDKSKIAWSNATDDDGTKSMSESSNEVSDPQESVSLGTDDTDKVDEEVYGINARAHAARSGKKKDAIMTKEGEEQSDRFNEKGLRVNVGLANGNLNPIPRQLNDNRAIQPHDHAPAVNTITERPSTPNPSGKSQGAAMSCNFRPVADRPSTPHPNANKKEHVATATASTIKQNHGKDDMDDMDDDSDKMSEEEIVAKVRSPYPERDRTLRTLYHPGHFEAASRWQDRSGSIELEANLREIWNSFQENLERPSVEDDDNDDDAKPPALIYVDRMQTVDEEEDDEGETELTFPKKTSPDDDGDEEMIDAVGTVAVAKPSGNDEPEESDEDEEKLPYTPPEGKDMSKSHKSMTRIDDDHVLDDIADPPYPRRVRMPRGLFDPGRGEATRQWKDKPKKARVTRRTNKHKVKGKTDKMSSSNLTARWNDTGMVANEAGLKTTGLEDDMSIKTVPVIQKGRTAHATSPTDSSMERALEEEESLEANEMIRDAVGCSKHTLKFVAEEKKATIQAAIMDTITAHVDKKLLAQSVAEVVKCKLVDSDNHLNELVGDMVAQEIVNQTVDAWDLARLVGENISAMFEETVVVARAIDDLMNRGVFPIDDEDKDGNDGELDGNDGEFGGN